MTKKLSVNPSTILETLQSFETVSLSDLEKVKLMNRVDTKYVVHINNLPEILTEMKVNYQILSIEERKIHRYESLYFDTPDFTLYKHHHNDKQNRFKVRYRKYADTGLCYFEIKYKEKGNRTKKIREERKDIYPVLQVEDTAMIDKDRLSGKLLEQKVMIRFDRITFANIQLKERITVDMNIEFEKGKEKKSLSDMVVCEIKQEKLNYRSPIVKTFVKRHHEEVSFSKYSIAIAMMVKIKNNNFKPNFVKINKLING